MADNVIPFGSPPSPKAEQPWRLVAISRGAPGYTIQIWTGRPTDETSIRALVGVRRMWMEAMKLAHDRARELAILEVVDWSEADPDEDPEPAA